ncbi:MAG: copper-binding protein [Pyrinomonadaceae bacterium]|jgi:Cu/Ag efflux protein CusF|nr:copper-binding protein [Pyrinomonadaceae bacterium]
MMKKLLISTVAIFSIACGGQNNVEVKNTETKPTPNVVNSNTPTKNQNVAVSTNNSTNQKVETSPMPNATTNQKPSATPVSNDPMNPQAKYFNGVGVVTKINMELGSVELDHEEIKGLMPKMIMEFFVKQPEKLKALKLGDKVEFVLEDKAGAEIITELKKIE